MQQSCPISLGVIQRYIKKRGEEGVHELSISVKVNPSWTKVVLVLREYCHFLMMDIGEYHADIGRHCDE